MKNTNNMNVLKIKCKRCGDELTAGELRTNEFMPVGRPYYCYQCSQKDLAEAKQRYQDKKNAEHCDMIEDQGFKWGGQKI